MTLLEVTIALVLVGTALTGGYQLYQTARSVTDRVDASVEALAAESAVRSVITSWLRFPVLGAEGFGFYGFDQRWQGLDDDRLQLWVRNPFPGEAGPSRLELFIDRDEATPEEGLVASIGTPPEPRTQRIVLAPGVGRFNLTFRGLDAPPGQSLPSWTSQSLTPRSVVMELGPRPGHRLPALLARPFAIAIGDAR